MLLEVSTATLCIRPHGGGCGSFLEPLPAQFRGPCKVRRLYATVRAVALYGSPVWADTLVASKRRLTLLRRIHKRVAIRMIRGYRTVSHTAAILLAKVAAHRTHRCMPKYTGVRRVRRGLDSVRAAVRLQARRRMLKRWDEDLSKPRDNSGKRVVEAIRSRLMK
ncbi:hypothetical protein ACFW04_013188 [Cataglyphis niger]